MSSAHSVCCRMQSESLKPGKWLLKDGKGPSKFDVCSCVVSMNSIDTESVCVCVLSAKRPTSLHTFSPRPLREQTTSDESSQPLASLVKVKEECERQDEFHQNMEHPQLTVSHFLRGFSQPMATSQVWHFNPKQETGRIGCFPSRNE